MNRLLISAAHKSSGKTTLSIGLCAALRQRGLAVQPFKKGPDFIDPMWLSLATGRDCHNLDFFLMGREEILRTFTTRSQGANISLIEGNKGLYDGLSLDGSNSNAALATLLQTPVVLVIDARGMTRGIAPLILGYQAFDKDIRLAGVILNQLGGTRHEAKLRAVIEHYTDIPVLGAVHRDDRLTIVERHLGLMPSNEATEARARIDAIGSLIADSVDLDRLLAIASDVPALTVPASPVPTLSHVLAGAHENHVRPFDGADVHRTSATAPSHPPGGRGDSEENPIKIGIARDAAFAFYYPGDLEALRAAGAELVPINMLQDKKLPDVDALLIGGGFPEVFMEQLEANASLRHQIRLAIETGLPTYAECGGLMYLARSLSWKGRRCEMAGVIPGDVVMHERPMGRGYVILRETGQVPWPAPATGPAPAEIRAHEFHYSTLENLPPDTVYAYEVLRGTGIDGRHDGIVHKNLFACYAHLRDLENNHWAARFVDFVRRRRHTGARQQHVH
ncbi:hydrogenase expression protein HypE [Sulfuricaulis limicola]|uniref:Cobyrinate a,c-diamide synthase n=1 Tax=Sulfuricaulis limicola TaxID=1620215 RepID=A0A1B4XFJ8_9GAMM|nr:cobyrinate a,c-diamide synthase [Sulfuricaulis limicola]BAV33574.1 hydrogenase expression protein HypE [Sulfuricaulis limicola]